MWRHLSAVSEGTELQLVWSKSIHTHTCTPTEVGVWKKTSRRAQEKFIYSMYVITGEPRSVSALLAPFRPVRAHVCLCSIHPSVWDSAADTSDCSLAQTPSCRKTDNWLFCGDPQRWQQPLLLVSLAIKLVSHYQLCDLKPHSEAESILWCWETAQSLCEKA